MFAGQAGFDGFGALVVLVVEIVVDRCRVGDGVVDVDLVDVGDVIGGGNFDFLVENELVLIVIG